MVSLVEKCLEDLMREGQVGEDKTDKMIEAAP